MENELRSLDTTLNNLKAQFEHHKWEVEMLMSQRKELTRRFHRAKERLPLAGSGNELRDEDGDARH
jgi:capsule polysaccharide export protein KpsE/RkpR